MNSIPQEIQIIGLPWYKADSFGECMALMHDRERLFKTYPDWLAAALITERNIKAQGKPVVRAFIEPVSFLAWCRKNRPGLDINAEARMDYASMIAAQ